MVLEFGGGGACHGVPAGLRDSQTCFDKMFLIPIIQNEVSVLQGQKLLFGTTLSYNISNQHP